MRNTDTILEIRFWGLAIISVLTSGEARLIFAISMWIVAVIMLFRWWEQRTFDSDTYGR